MNITIAPMENKFYVYAHRRNNSNEIFYIGKGKGKRAWETSKRNQYWKNIVNKHGYSVQILMQDLSEELAFTFEKILILKIGRENLVNMTDGGDGVSGLVHSEKTRQKMAQSRKGEKAPFFGKKHSAESRQKISDAKPKKPVFQYTKNGQFIAKFNSTREASRVTEISNGDISKCCQGKRKSAGGYVWRHSEN